jgi:hypothetical protein
MVRLGLRLWNTGPDLSLRGSRGHSVPAEISRCDPRRTGRCPSRWGGVRRGSEVGALPKTGIVQRGTSSSVPSTLGKAAQPSLAYPPHPQTGCPSKTLNWRHCSRSLVGSAVWSMGVVSVSRGMIIVMQTCGQQTASCGFHFLYGLFETAASPPSPPACTLTERRPEEGIDCVVLVIDRDAMPGIWKNLHRDGSALCVQLLREPLCLLNGHPLILRPVQ